jgi:hypothetical protein
MVSGRFLEKIFINELNLDLPEAPLWLDLEVSASAFRWIQLEKRLDLKLDEVDAGRDELEVSLPLVSSAVDSSVERTEERRALLRT